MVVFKWNEKKRKIPKTSFREPESVRTDGYKLYKWDTKISDPQMLFFSLVSTGGKVGICTFQRELAEAS